MDIGKVPRRTSSRLATPGKPNIVTENGVLDKGELFSITRVGAGTHFAKLYDTTKINEKSLGDTGIRWN